MKKFFTVLAAMITGTVILTAQTRYLVNTLKPVDSFHYKEYKGSAPMAMSGGLVWHNGFSIDYVDGPYKPGYATFDLGGQYEILMFVLGHMNTGGGAGGSGADINPRIFTVHVDGRKVIDKVIYPYSLYERVSLDVKGAREVKFAVLEGSAVIGIAEATLWKAGETPKETGNIRRGDAAAVELVRDLRPYFQNYLMASVSPQDKETSMSINGQKYEYGLKANMSMAIIGNNPGWAYFNLRGQYERVSMLLGPIDDVSGHRGKGWITVKADGKIIKEVEVSYEDVAQRIVLDVTGCRCLSFHSEQSEGSTAMGLAEIMAYPPGTAPEISDDSTASTADPRLKSLPDVCKLISNIPPYAAGSKAQKQIYDGSSDHITFSMGGVRFSEGIILYDKVSVLSSNTSAFATFDLGNEFDYVSFTAGYIGKSGAMNNDVLRVYADDELVLEAPLIATAPNKDYVVAINRCRKLRFENQGSGSLDVAAYGVGDIVVYRGEPVENDLFVHPKPECPHTVDLIDLGAPYIHYVSPMSDHKDQIFHDGSTMREYFDLNGQRIYKGFMLQTSVHFSLDYGPLSGTDGAAAGALGGAAVGAAFVPAGISVGGAMVGSSLVGAAAFLMLAAGGEAMENSCAAFNTYGEYNSVTFTVACLNPHINATGYTETLLIGADHKVVAQVAVYDTMEPQTITVPIDGCEQLMFWLANTDNWSGQFIFYDIVLSKDKLELDVPKAARLSEAVVTVPEWNAAELQCKWERPKSSGQSEVDAFLSGISNMYEKVEKYVTQMKPQYEIYTYYLETDAGMQCKAVTLESLRGDNLNRIQAELSGCLNELETLQSLRSTIVDLTIGQASAGIGLLELGFGAFGYGKLLKSGGDVLKECRSVTEQMYEDKAAEARFLQSVVNGKFDADGKTSTETTILCPLAEGETPPSDLLQQVKHFVFR